MAVKIVRYLELGAAMNSHTLKVTPVCGTPFAQVKPGERSVLGALGMRVGILDVFLESPMRIPSPQQSQMELNGPESLEGSVEAALRRLNEHQLLAL